MPDTLASNLPVPEAQDDPAFSTEPSPLDLAHDVWLDTQAPPLLSTFRADPPPVYWPKDDANAPDYCHLSAGLAVPETFEITPQVLDLLIRANRFSPEGHDDVIAIAFRGCLLAGGVHERVRQPAILVHDARPDHVDFRCVLGFYLRSQGLLTLLTGSTVPCPYYMENYYFRMNGLPYETSIGCNVMPTGCYVSRVDRHSDIRPAVRTADPEKLREDGKVTVLRTTNDLTFGIQDTWDYCTPYDNIHCSYYLNVSPKHKARFSSAGCLTVRGRKSPASDQWKKYQAQLTELGQDRRIDSLLLTGREAAIAAALLASSATPDPATVQRELGRLRVGSYGDEVRRLQSKLGLYPSGFFSAETRDTLWRFQRRNQHVVNALYSPALDQALGWQVFAS